MKRWRVAIRPHIGIYIAVVVFVLQVILVPHTGMTWDEPSSFFFGRANLRFWLTGDRQYVTDFKNPKRFDHEPIDYIYGEDMYPPFPFVVSSAFSLVFSEKLHLMSFIDAHHLGEVVIGAIGVGFFYYLLVVLGCVPAVAALTTVFYGLYPVIFGQMRADAKDIPLMSMLVIAMYWLVQWYRALQARDRRAGRYGLVFTVIFGLALGSKPTAVVMVPIISAWLLLPVLAARRVQLVARALQHWVQFLVWVAGAVLVMIAVWPWLWDDPIEKLTASWQFFRVVGYQMPVLYLGKVYMAGVNVPKIYPFVVLLLQTPLELTILAALGTTAALYRVLKKGDRWALLVLLWFWLGLLRFMVPGVLIYARVRHFIDVMPAFFILVAYGMNLVIGRPTSGLRARYQLLWYIGLVIIVHEVSIISHLYPYEPSYYNFFVGGAKGVAQKQLFDIDYWGNGVTEAVEYLNTHVPDARVYACGLWHVAHFYEKGTTKIVRTGEQATHIVIPNSPSWFGGAIDFHKKHDTIIHTVVRDGAPLYFIFKRTSPAWWSCGYETETNQR